MTMFRVALVTLLAVGVQGHIVGHTQTTPAKTAEPPKAAVPKKAAVSKEAVEAKKTEEPKKAVFLKAKEPTKIEEPKKVEAPKQNEAPTKVETANVAVVKALDSKMVAEPKKAVEAKKVETPKVAVVKTESPKKVVEPKKAPIAGDAVTFLKEAEVAASKVMAPKEIEELKKIEAEVAALKVEGQTKAAEPKKVEAQKVEVEVKKVAAQKNLVAVKAEHARKEEPKEEAKAENKTAAEDDKVEAPQRVVATKKAEDYSIEAGHDWKGERPVLLPEHGYYGKDVRHEDYMSATADWAEEYGPKNKKSAPVIPVPHAGSRRGAIVVVAALAPVLAYFAL